MLRSSDNASRLRSFIEHEATGGMLLAAAAAFAMLAVNLGFYDEYQALLEQKVTIGVGSLTLEKSLHHFINDGLMTVFFFLVGMEIKREALEGSLSELSQIVLPFAAAIGGIAVPSAIYAWLNWHDPIAIRGWAIPSATDIAFALGALALVGSRVPVSLKIFLLALATIDDLAAILIIALFYSGGLSTLALTGAAACLAMLLVLNRINHEKRGPYLLIGLLLWLCVLKSGVHATLAGVALGLLIPLKRSDGSSMLHEFEDSFHPYVKFLVLPLFAFANAGLPLSGLTWENLSSGLPLGIIGGLAVGKPVGIVVTCALIIGLGFARLPNGSTWRDIVGVGFLAGIGFTMSLFIGSLAFDASMQDQVRSGVIVGSIISIVFGLTVLLTAPRKI